MLNRKCYEAKFTLVRDGNPKDVEYTFLYRENEEDARNWILDGVRKEYPEYEIYAMTFKVLDF